MDMTPLLETILHRVLPPVADVDGPFQMLVTMLDYDNYIGRIAVGRVEHGRITPGEPLVLVKRDGHHERGRATKILKYRGLQRVEASEALATQIIEHCRGSIAGFKAPRKIEFVADLPRTETGKIRRVALRELAQGAQS